MYSSSIGFGGTSTTAPRSSSSSPHPSDTLYYEDNSSGTSDEFPKALPCRRIVAIILLTLTIVLLGCSALVVQWQLAHLSHDVEALRRERDEGFRFLENAVRDLKSAHVAMQAAHAQAEEQLETRLTSALEDRASLQEELGVAKNEPAPRTLEALEKLDGEIEVLGGTVADSQREAEDMRKAKEKVLVAAANMEALAKQVKDLSSIGILWITGK